MADGLGLLDVKGSVAFVPPGPRAGAATLSEAFPARRAIRRHLTWEDSLPRSELQPMSLFFSPTRNQPWHHLHLGAWAAGRNNRNGGLCKAWACVHWFAPLAVGTVQRPAAGFVVDAGIARYFVADIPKAASTTLSSWFAREGSGLSMLNYLHPTVVASCANTSYLDSALRMSQLAAGEPRTGADGPLVGCGHASSFELGQSVNLAVVRDPVRRFISALDPHRGTPGPSAEPSLVRRWAATVAGAYGLGSLDDEAVFGNVSSATLELLARRASAMRAGRFYDDPHARTQSYFLSATDATGRPLEWEAILQLEDGGTLASMQAYARSMLKAAHRSEIPARALLRRHENARAVDSSISAEAHLLRAVLAHPSIPCDLCAIYGQDFACLGYRFPDACSQAACLADLPPEIRAAVAAQRASRAVNS